MKIENIEHMTDNQLIMFALLAILKDIKFTTTQVITEELGKRTFKLRQNLPLEEHKKYYGGKDG